MPELFRASNISRSPPEIVLRAALIILYRKVWHFGKNGVTPFDFYPDLLPRLTYICIFKSNRAIGIAVGKEEERHQSRVFLYSSAYCILSV